MIKVMHDFMFAAAPYVIPVAVIAFLGGWAVGILKWDLRPAMLGMLLFIGIALLIGAFMLVYALIGGPAVYPNG
jgi:hypothetical protein